MASTFPRLGQDASLDRPVVQASPQRPEKKKGVFQLLEHRIGSPGSGDSELKLTQMQLLTKGCHLTTLSLNVLI